MPWVGGGSVTFHRFPDLSRPRTIGTSSSSATTKSDVRTPSKDLGVNAIVVMGTRLPRSAVGITRVAREKEVPASASIRAMEAILDRIRDPPIGAAKLSSMRHGGLDRGAVGCDKGHPIFHISLRKIIMAQS